MDPVTKPQIPTARQCAVWNHCLDGRNVLSRELVKFFRSMQSDWSKGAAQQSYALSLRGGTLGKHTSRPPHRPGYKDTEDKYVNHADFNLQTVDNHCRLVLY